MEIQSLGGLAEHRPMTAENIIDQSIKETTKPAKGAAKIGLKMAGDSLYRHITRPGSKVTNHFAREVLRKILRPDS